ncbi:MAG: amidohydrolase family protein [Anaerolineales bacterium]|nr:amidohydrolase family protein [Anaerolineales bacterium]
MIGDSELTREFWEQGRAASCPIFDMHGHMGVWHSIYFPRPDADDMVRTMDECGVRLLVFSHHMALFAPDLANAPAVAAVRRFPDRLRAYCSINPNYPERIEADLSAFGEYTDVYVGFKFLPDYHGIPLSDARYRPAWEYADARELLILTHTWGGSTLDGPAVLRQMAERYPRVRLLLGHSCHGEWDAAVRLARDFPNIYLELTAIFDDRGILEKFAHEAGSERMLFGTDLPWFDPHQAVGALLSAHISDDDRHNICHRNAEQLLAPFLYPNR